MSQAYVAFKGCIQGLEGGRAGYGILWGRAVGEGNAKVRGNLPGGVFALMSGWNSVLY